jgi:large subunit ribosomal protein L10
MIMTALQKKQEVVDSVKSDLENAAAVYVLDFTGLTVEKDNALRKALTTKGIKYRAVKNTLLNIALEQLEMGIPEGALVGASAIMIGNADDPMLPAKEIVEFHKENPDFLAVKGINLDGQVMNGNQVEALSKMPGREELITEIVTIALGPGANLVSLLKGPGSTIAGQLKALEEKLEN